MKFLLFLTLLCASAVYAVPAETSLSYKGSTFSYYSSHDINLPNDSIEHAIIVIHGSERNADTYYKSIETMAKRLGHTEKTFIISTHFKEQKDVLIPNELVWTEEGWLSGDQSLTNEEISSFEIMDHFIELLSKLSHLKKITITGHSAGGQLTQRLAVGSRADLKFPHLQFKYMVLNPGSYVYLTKNRPISLPENSSCAFNNYKYGLDNLNPYMGQTPVSEMTSSYLNRNIIYLIGDQDTRSDDIDQECQAVVQGHTRLERAQNFKMQLDQEFPEHHHELHIVPGIGHTQWGMYTSETGSKLLFN